jgi:flavin-dependent dehydrogenase
VNLDVAILGGGLAGSLLARQLHRTLPGLRVAVFEKSTATSFKVGESMVEIAGNYLVRRLALATYLYDHHLPKNGLRFFFDTLECDAELHRMSEIGTMALPFHQSFQVNRARLEADLHAMNAADGVVVRTGARVRDLVLGEDGAPHRFGVDGERATVSCRWLVDAAGRSSLIARARRLRVPEPTHEIAAVWGRFEGVADIDDGGPEEFRARVRHASRMLSTIHFGYDGYWIWFIPLKYGVTSVGVVGERRAVDTPCRTRAGFLAFLRRHGAVAALLANATLVDVGSFAQLAYGTRRFFSAARWGLSGEAGAFADPFYSPGSDYIALENDFLTDLVRRDFGGEPPDELGRRADLYERFMQFRHEAALLLYRGLYSTLGSYELFKLKWDLDIASYYNLWVSPYMQDQHLDPAFLEQQLRERQPTLQALGNFAALFRKVEASLKARGAFHRGNLGRFSEPLDSIDYTAQIGRPRPRAEVLARTADAFNRIRARALDLLEEPAPASGRKTMPLAAFMLARPLA